MFRLLFKTFATFYVLKYLTKLNVVATKKLVFLFMFDPTLGKCLFSFKATPHIVQHELLKKNFVCNDYFYFICSNTASYSKIYC